MRIGEGYDVHKLCKNRPLIIGGVKIPYKMGLLGHSDADVLIHAVCDALLGAAALGDIGSHFPPSDDSYKNIDSSVLLSKVNALLKEHGFKVINVDSTIIAEAPKMLPYIEKMRENIAKTLQIDIDKISVKATTEEGLGFTGKKKGIAARAVVLAEEL